MWGVRSTGDFLKLLWIVTDDSELEMGIKAINVEPCSSRSCDRAL